MIIGLYFNDKGFWDLDLRNPVNGNNGCGGTQYCFVMFADALIKYSDCKVIFYHYNNNILPDGIESRLINSVDSLIEAACADHVDILIFKAEGVKDFVKNLRHSGLHAIAWAHNYILSKELAEYCDNPAISRVVFVGHEMYDMYIDHPIMEKAAYIYNMFDGRVFEARSLPAIPAVTYVGSLVRSKGFHVLAEIWKDVVKKVPEAQLYVIGSGKLYNRNSELGSFGIAAKSYENKFMPFLTVNGEVMKSVHFLGTMGKEKVDIFNKTSVGVMNPTGETETFGLSAVEMSACGIPVVTKKANGLLDTVIDGKTGFLIRNKKELIHRIVQLLTDNDLNCSLGKSGKEFANTTFLPEKLCRLWTKMFEDILSEKTSDYIQPKCNFTNNAKWLRIINRKLQDMGLGTKPLIDLECSFREFIRRLRRK